MLAHPIYLCLVMIVYGYMGADDVVGGSSKT